MTTTSERIVTLLRDEGVILDNLYYSGKRLVWDEDRWKVWAGKYWEYCVYAGNSLSDALDELMRDGK